MSKSGQVQCPAAERPRSGFVRNLWLALGIVATGLAFAGAMLPLLPTTPFLLVAAYAFTRSSPSWHRWLVTHRVLGPILSDWQQHKAVGRSIKLAAILVMMTSLVASAMAGFGKATLAAQFAALSIAGAFVVSRPRPPSQRHSPGKR
ncbi:MAG: YbaN family protein [Hyphomicrobiaceae bacterium]|nr:YbaN family protein [Hyphomicrobiaceae bacterium]